MKSAFFCHKPGPTSGASCQANPESAFSLSSLVWLGIVSIYEVESKKVLQEEMPLIHHRFLHNQYTLYTGQGCGGCGAYFWNFRHKMRMGTQPEDGAYIHPPQHKSYTLHHTHTATQRHKQSHTQWHTTPHTKRQFYFRQHVFGWWEETGDLKGNHTKLHAHTATRVRDRTGDSSAVMWHHLATLNLFIITGKGNMFLHIRWKWIFAPHTDDEIFQQINLLTLTAFTSENQKQSCPDMYTKEETMKVVGNNSFPFGSLNIIDRDLIKILNKVHIKQSWAHKGQQEMKNFMTPCV